MKITTKRAQNLNLLEGLPNGRKIGGQVRAEDKLAWTMPNGSHLLGVNLRKAKRIFKSIVLSAAALLIFSCNDDFVNERLDISGVAASAIIISPAWEVDHYQFQCEDAGNSEFIIDSKPDWLNPDDNSGRFVNDVATIHCKASTVQDFSKTGIYIDQMLVVAGEKKYAVPVYYITEGNPSVQVNRTFEISYNNYNNQLQISNQGDGILFWDVISMPDWLTVDMNQLDLTSVILGQGAAASIPFTLDAEKAMQGDPTGTIVLRTNDKNNPHIEIAVSADLGTPDLGFFEGRLEFSSSETSKTIRIYNNGDGILIWNFEELPEWLSVSPANGISLPHSSSSEVIFTCDRSKLEPGLHSATIYLKSNDLGTPSSSVNVLIRAPGIPANIRALEGNITDATFDKNTNTLYYAIGQPNKLIAYDVIDKSVSHEIALNKAPTCLAISEDYTKAAIGHGGMISVVDLGSYSVIKTYELNTTVYDIEWTNDGWFCYTQANSTSSNLFWINTNTDETYETIPSDYYTLGTARLKKVPNQPYLIASRTNVSPTGIFVFDTNTKSQKSYAHESIGNIWFMNDGQLMLTGYSDVIRTATVTEATGDHLSTTSPIGELKVTDYSYVTWCADILESSHSIWAIFSYYDHSYYPPVASTIYQFEDNDYTLVRTYTYDNLYQPDAQAWAYEVEAHYVFSNSSATELSVLRKGKNNTNWSVEFIPVQQ